MSTPTSPAFPAVAMPAKPAPGLVHVGTYRRRVALSLAAVYENALDWEHLPFLHAQDFSAIRCHAAGDWGWRAHVTSQPASAGAYDLELLLDRGRALWVSRPIGALAGSAEIWSWATAVAVAAADEATAEPAPLTDLAIEFHVLPSAARDPARAFERRKALYQRLWDQDEAFSWSRARQLEQRRRRRAERALQPARLGLGTDAMLRARLPLQIEFDGDLWWVREKDGAVIVHAAQCPHMLGPLDGAPDEHGCVRCPWHGYRFDIDSGAAVDGTGLALPRAPQLSCEDGDWWLHARR